VLLGGVATWFAQSPHRRDERHWRRETERLHRELDAARRAPANQALLDVDDLAHPQ
jgi:predicted phosphohydrolase